MKPALFFLLRVLPAPAGAPRASRWRKKGEDKRDAAIGCCARGWPNYPTTNHPSKSKSGQLRDLRPEPLLVDYVIL